MKLFQQLAASIKAGVVFHMTVRAAGENMQVELHPECDAGKTGIAIPHKALIATPEELDAAIPGFLETYLASSVNLTEQIEQARVAMAAAEDAAKEAVKKAATTKVAPKASSPTGTSTVIPSKRRGSATTLLDDDDLPDDGGDACGLPATGEVPGAAPAEAVGSLSLDVFKL